MRAICFIFNGIKVTQNNVLADCAGGTKLVDAFLRAADNAFKVPVFTVQVSLADPALRGFC